METGCFCVVRAEMLEATDKVSWASVEFCMGGYEGRTWAREAEKSPLLKTAARERLVKTQQAGKGLADAVVICKFVEISSGAVNACSSE
jgi:hypothetical protein